MQVKIETYGVPIDILRHRVNDDICAVIQWVLHIGTEEGIVDHHHDSVLMCNRSNFADIDQCQGGIAGTFDPDQLRFMRPYQFGNVDFDTRGECDLDPMCGSDLCKVAVCSSIYIRNGDDVGASGKRLEDSGGRCGTG